tara:strand:- start:3336 stop:4457 length:1122 start_codon:yes stop_codon:yes gene_type:complete
MDDNNNLEMDLFGDQGLELNLDGLEDFQETSDDQDVSNENNDDSQESTDEINNQGEDQDSDSESVTEEDDQDEGSEGDDSPNLFSSVATVLQEQGLLPSLDIAENKIENVEDLASAMKAEAENLAKSTIIDKIGEEGYEYINKGISVDEYNAYKTTADTLNNITEDSLSNDIELSKKVIFQDYINNGISESKASKLIERLSDLGDDSIIEDATESLVNVKDFNKSALDNQAETIAAENALIEKQQQDVEKQLKKSVYDTKELIKGQSINKGFQDKVYNSMTKIVGKSPTGDSENALMKQRREDPVDFDTKLYYVYEMTKGFKDFSKFTASAKSSAISDMERALKNNSINNAESPSYLQDGESYSDGLGAELNY